MRTIVSVIAAAAIPSGGVSIIITAQTSAHVVQNRRSAVGPRRRCCRPARRSPCSRATPAGPRRTRSA